MTAGRGKRGTMGVAVATVMVMCMGIAASYIHLVDSDVYLLVDIVSDLRTELVEGNFTDGHVCFDFPTYHVNEDAHKANLFTGKPPDRYSLAYGSGHSAGGLVSSGGASGLRFMDKLPFTTSEEVDDGNESFTVKITVTEKMDVLLEGKPFNGPFRLEPGRNWTYSYDVVKEHQNTGDGCCNGTTCLIRYAGSTTIKNYGIWKKSGVEFRD